MHGELESEGGEWKLVLVGICREGSKQVPWAYKVKECARWSVCKVEGVQEQEV